MNKEQQLNEQQNWKLLVLLLKNIAKEKGIIHEQIAEKTGINRANVSRIFGVKYCPSLANFLAIASALDINFFFDDKEGKTDLNRILEKAMEELGRRSDKLPEN